MASSYIVRHGAMRFLGTFEAEGDTACARGMTVIVRTERGQEVGEVLCEANPKAVEMIAEPSNGKVVRGISADDRTQLERIQAAERKEFEVCQNLVSQRKLQMELVDVEHLLGESLGEDFCSLCVHDPVSLRGAPPGAPITMILSLSAYFVSWKNDSSVEPSAKVTYVR